MKDGCMASLKEEVLRYKKNPSPVISTPPPNKKIPDLLLVFLGVEEHKKPKTTGGIV